MQTSAWIWTIALCLGIWVIARPLRARVWAWLVKTLEPAAPEYYDASFPYARVLAPTFWLLIVWACLLLMLHAAGYLSADPAPDALARFKEALQASAADAAVQRAAFGFSGVTLAITVALSLTSLFWCAAAAWKRAGAYRVAVFFWAAALLVLALTVSHDASVRWTPFTSELGALLLERAAQEAQSALAQYIPLVMFALSSVVPSMLLAGATYLLQPMALGVSEAVLKQQLHLLKGRLRELDQMLYIGALALVFGTLQLSSSLSVPLVSMPRAADLKAHADLCKALDPPAPGSSVVFFASKASGPAGLNRQCQQIPGAFARLEAAEGLRQLVRGITLCFGLSFSALLAAIYVPSLIVLRNMIEKRQATLADIQAQSAQPAKADGEPLVVDPFSRIAAVFATLSPLLAGLVANILASG